MMCSRCKKRMAVVFVTKIEGEKTINEGLCLTCAKELGIKPVNDLVEQMGISDDEMESVSKELMEFMGGENEEMFEPGGATTFPFLQNLFTSGSGNQNADADTKRGADRKQKRDKKEQESKRKHLAAYCEDLTQKARDGKIDNIIGRDKEIERVVQILNRRTKNNPCLIGEPGVGKTAVAEGIALRITSGDVPPRLQDKEIFLLDLTALVAGTQFRGQFESRVKGLVEEVKQAGNIILFIDEVHNLVGAGDSEGSMNAANILKPSLSRGEIQVIGATTFNEYRKNIEKDAALERRFQPVTIEEPTIADSIDVLRGIKRYYESYHRVHITDELIRSVVLLSERYINDRFLPDKAIDLLDEACSCAALRSKELAEYDRLSKDYHHSQMEESALEQEPDAVDYERLATVKAHTLQLKDQLLQLEPAATSVTVTDDDIAKVIELWTGIPSSKIKENEFEKVKNLEARLKAKVIGQDEAVELVAAAVKRAKVQVSARRRPASFIFVGPTAVGKTELVKVLASELFDTPDPLIRLDMSEYMEKYSVSRIIGAPPGYIGYDEAGQLTEKVRRKPYSVILFDEIEKAHPDVLNILLQILDEGKITDAHGRKVSFENTVIVMTSNAGSQFKDNTLGFNKSAFDLAKDKAMKSLNEFLRPEFISRVDEIVVFSPLTKENYAKIAALMLTELVEPLKEKGIVFTFDDEACACIAELSFGSKTGAREIRRVIRKSVEDKIAGMIADAPSSYPTRMKLTKQDGALEILAL
ncbi:ATP-dependent Clp protease ATP-binding subunit [Acetanaerobacterium elongatum]|nr:ATP-dependent Clp protease ATP-binding subunit [Acetanaerobacterium elongatum]